MSDTNQNIRLSQLLQHLRSGQEALRALSLTADADTDTEPVTATSDATRTAEQLREAKKSRAEIKKDLAKFRRKQKGKGKKAKKWLCCTKPVFKGSASNPAKKAWRSVCYYRIKGKDGNVRKMAQMRMLSSKRSPKPNGPIRLKSGKAMKWC